MFCFASRKLSTAYLSAENRPVQLSSFALFSQYLTCFVALGLTFTLKEVSCFHLRPVDNIITGQDKFQQKRNVKLTCNFQLEMFFPTLSDMRSLL